MPALVSLDLIVRDVPASVAFFRDVVGLTVLQAFDCFAELEGRSLKILLSPDALVPVSPARGIILHFEEPDLPAAVRRATAFGSVVLKGPLTTDWGVESVLVQGPEAIVIDFQRPVVSPPAA